LEQSPGRRFIEYKLPDDATDSKLDADIKTCRERIETDPENAENYFRLATFMITKEKPGDAIQLLEQCLRRNADHMEAFFLLGNCYIKHNQHEIAARYYLKALKINSDHIPSLFNIGLCYMELGMKKKAVSAFKKFYALEESNQWREEAKYQLYKLGVNL
jgi:tetratricopeptide (TPR) repeat protein